MIWEDILTRSYQVSDGDSYIAKFIILIFDILCYPNKIIYALFHSYFAEIDILNFWQWILFDDWLLFIKYRYT